MGSGDTLGRRYSRREIAWKINTLWNLDGDILGVR